MNKAGLDLLKEFEGFRDKAYIPVPGDVPTIGYGFTKGVKMGDKMTRAQADRRLAKEVAEFEDAVSDACKVTPNENEHAAMTCLAYNIGLGWDPAKGTKPRGAKDGFRQSSVLRAHNRGDAQSAARAFGLWNKSSGKVYAGLTRRRAAESSLYLKPVPEDQEDHPMPQQVDSESSLARSPINVSAGVSGVGGAVTVAGSLLGGAGEVGDHVSTAADSVGGVASAVSTAKGALASLAGAVGLTPVQLLGVVLVVIAGVIIFYRVKQRSGGWA